MYDCDLEEVKKNLATGEKSWTECFPKHLTIWQKLEISEVLRKGYLKENFVEPSEESKKHFKEQFTLYLKCDLHFTDEQVEEYYKRFPNGL